MMMALTIIYQATFLSLDEEKVNTFINIIEPSIRILNSPNPLK